MYRRYLVALFISALMIPVSLVVAGNMSEEDMIEQQEMTASFNDDNDETGQSPYEDDPIIDTGDIDEDTADTEE